MLSNLQKPADEFVSPNESKNEHTGTIDPEIYRLSLLQDVPAPAFTLLSDGIPFASGGNLIALIGPPKAGKSTLCAIIAAAAVGQMDVCGIRGQKLKKITWIDSEQTDYYARLQFQRAAQLSGLGLAEFDRQNEFYALRKAHLCERSEALFNILYRSRDSLIIADGITDFIPDGINNEGAAVGLCAQIMNIAETNNLTFLAVIHTNNGGNARGWVGGELTRKVETSIHIKTNDAGLFDVTFPYTRGRKPNPFSFMICENGLPYLIDAPLKEPGRPEKYSADFWTNLFDGKNELTTAELREKLIARGVKESVTKQAISDAKRKGILAQSGERMPYNLSKD